LLDILVIDDKHRWSSTGTVGQTGTPFIHIRVANKRAGSRIYYVTATDSQFPPNLLASLRLLRAHNLAPFSISDGGADCCQSTPVGRSPAGRKCRRFRPTAHARPDNEQS